MKNHHFYENFDNFSHIDKIKNLFDKTKKREK